MSFRLAAYGVCIEDGRVLLACHVAPKGKFTWTLPGGSDPSGNRSRRSRPGRWPDPALRQPRPAHAGVPGPAVIPPAPPDHCSWRSRLTILKRATLSSVVHRWKPAFSSTRTEAGLGNSAPAATVWTSGAVKAKFARARAASVA